MGLSCLELPPLSALGLALRLIPCTSRRTVVCFLAAIDGIVNE